MKNSKKSILFRVIKEVFTAYPVLFPLVLVSIVFTAGVSSIPSLFIQKIVSLLEARDPSVSWSVFSKQMITLILILIGVDMLSLILTAVYNLAMATITQGTLYHMRKKMFVKMQTLPLKYFDTEGHGDIMSYYTNDVDALRQMISQSLPNVLTSLVVVVTVFGIMLYFSFWMTLTVLLGVVAMYFVTKYVGKHSRKYFIEQQKSLGKTEGYLEEMIYGQKVVKVFNYEDESMKKFNEVNDKLFDDSQKANSYANILNAVTNIDIRNNSLMNLPFITFYCNGNIDRNLQFSLEADKSIIAETTTDVGARTLPNLIKGVASAVAEGVTGTNSSTGGQVAAAGANAVGGSVDSATEILREIAYHNDGNFASTFVTNTYIPKVMRGGSTNVSYNVPLRFVAAGSDKYSIAQMFWGLCLLLPFVVQVSKPKMPLIIPQAAMYCAAFSKGVMNVPRGYISSMSISTDPAFQTTNGIPLELNINLTIESLYTLTTMPNFTETYGGGSDMNLLTAMWHPMSSFNVVATLTGTNTVLNHTPSNIFKYYIEKPVADAFVAFKTIFQTSGGYFGTQFKQWRIQLDSGDNMQYI